MKIAVLSLDDPNDREAPPGMPDVMASAVESIGHDVLRLRIPSPSIERLLTRAGATPGLPTGRSRMLRANRPVAWEVAQITAPIVAACDADVLLLPMSATVASHLRTGKTAVYVSDAPFAAADELRPRSAQLSRRAVRIADEIERRAIQRSDVVSFPSRWAAEWAVEHYGADPATVHVIPWGSGPAPRPVRDALGAVVGGRQAAQHRPPAAGAASGSDPGWTLWAERLTAVLDAAGPVAAGDKSGVRSCVQRAGLTYPRSS